MQLRPNLPALRPPRKHLEPSKIYTPQADALLSHGAHQQLLQVGGLGGNQAIHACGEVGRAEGRLAVSLSSAALAANRPSTPAGPGRGGRGWEVAMQHVWVDILHATLQPS